MSTQLAKKQCVPCRGNVPPLAPTKIRALHSEPVVSHEQLSGLLKYNDRQAA